MTEKGTEIPEARSLEYAPDKRKADDNACVNESGLHLISINCDVDHVYPPHKYEKENGFSN